MEGALRGGHHLRAVHRLRRLRDLVPPRRDRLRPRVGRLQAVPPRGRARPRPTAATARRAARQLHPGLPPLPGCGSRRPTSTSSTATAAATRSSGIYSDILLTRASDDMVHQMGQDGGLVSAILIWALEQGYIDGALTSYLEGDADSAAGRPSPAWPPTATRSWPAPAAATPTRPTRWRSTRPWSRGLSKLALVGMSCQSSVPPVMWHRKIGKIAQADRVQHRPAVLEDLRRRHLRGAVRGQVRPAQVRDREDEHQGRLPDLDARRRATTRSTSRSATPGPARAAPTAPTSRPSTPTSPPAASARTTTGRSPSCAPTSVGRSSTG